MNPLVRTIGLVWLWLATAAAPAAFAEGRGAAFGVEASGAVVDQAGRRIETKRPFRRIVSLYGAHTENLFYLGLNAEIIGVSRNEVHPPEALAKPVFSYHDDPEKFMAAAPDLVLLRPMIDRGYPRLVARLEKSGITVVSVQPGTVEEMYRYWEMLGALTGTGDAAAAMTAAFRAEVARIRALTRARHPRKRVYFEAIHDRMKTFSPDAMALFVLETAGGINVAADAEPVRGTNIAYYGKERILARGGEIDVFIAQKGSMNRPTRELIRNEPGFAAIKAVRDDRILIVDEMIVSRPTPRLLQGIEVIGRYLYPELFPAAGE